MSLPAMVIKASDSYGLWMTLYFGTMCSVLIKYTLCDLVESVIHRRIVLQRKRFTARLEELRWSFEDTSPPESLTDQNDTDQNDTDQIGSKCREMCFLY